MIAPRLARTLTPWTLLLAATTLRASEELRFVVVGAACADCAPRIVKALDAVPGVSEAKLDGKSGAASVGVGGDFDRDKIRKALQDLGFEAVFAGDKPRGLEPLPEETRRALDIASASDGEKVDLARTLVSGKITLIDYWASWCGPCHLLELRLQRLAQANPSLAVRRVNVANFDNPAGKQAAKEFHMQAIPYVRVYDAKGQFVGDDTGGGWGKILELVERAERGGHSDPS